MAAQLCSPANMTAILAANADDMAAAKGHISEVMLDRLALTEERIRAMAKGIEEVAALPDPVGRVLETSERPNGLLLQKVTVPMGVIAIIYESRPNVTSDAAALAIKSGSACVLRGGKEAIRSNTAFAEIMCGALEGAGLPRDGIQLVTDTSRASAGDLMTLDGYLDALIPRGGKGLIQAVVKGASVPVIETGAGNCHIYVDDSADLEMAVRVCDNAKTSRPSVCNAVETVLVHREIAAAFLPRLKEALDVHHVELRGCARTAALIPGVVPAAEEDYDTEFDDYILCLLYTSPSPRDRG